MAMDTENTLGEQPYWDAMAQLHQEDAKKRLEYSSMYAASAIKSLFLLNGGSIISLLTFIGNNEAKFGHRGLFWSFTWFFCGIFFSLLSFFGAYFSQSYFMNASYARASDALGRKLQLTVQTDAERPAFVGNVWIVVAVAAATMSAICFGFGAFVTLVAIL